MYVFSNVAEQDVEYMVFRVVHKDMTTFKDVVLGVVPIELHTVMNSPNITQDEWRPLRKTADTAVDTVLGELRVQMTYMMDDIELAEEQELDEASLTHKPNFLSLTLEKARNLVVAPGRTAIDPEASITVVGKKFDESKSTTCVRNDINPRWNWKGSWYVHALLRCPILTPPTLFPKPPSSSSLRS